MPRDDEMEPLERLLNLVGLLLETERPMTFEQIRRILPAYGGDNLDSAKRKFERDKDVLREYGVPLEMEATDVWDVEHGYTIPKARYYLPEIAFTPEEVSALFVAAQGGTEETAAEQAIRKLIYGADGGVLIGVAGGPLVSGSDARGPRVLAAAEAATGHRRVRFPYRSSQGVESSREVDVYGVVFRGGRWYLVGHDHERAEIRAFRLSRCTGDLEDVGDGSGPPQGFRATDHIEAGPATATGDDRAVIAFDRDAAVLAEGTFAAITLEGRRDDGWTVYSVPATDDALLAGVLLQFGPDAEVLEPSSLRNEMIRRLQAIDG
jgi:proteasome accessory factor B